MTEKKREVLSLPFVEIYWRLSARKKILKTAVLTTAVEVDEALLQKAEKILEKELGTQVELTGRVNPHIIGGIILRIDDKQYDDSIATQLKKMKQNFLKAQL
jgi:F-type H+-transporting ATPase subunit delta